MSSYLHNNPLVIFFDRLVDAGIFGSPDTTAGVWPLYKTYLPDGDNSEHNAACIYETDPQIDARTMDLGLELHYGFSISIRCSDYLIGWAKAMATLNNLLNLSNETKTIGSYSYNVRAIVSNSGILPKGFDERRRNVFEIIFLATIQESAL
jgi:hypothetical protein